MSAQDFEYRFSVHKKVYRLVQKISLENFSSQKIKYFPKISPQKSLKRTLLNYSFWNLITCTFCVCLEMRSGHWWVGVSKNFFNWLLDPIQKYKPWHDSSKNEKKYLKWDEAAKKDSSTDLDLFVPLKDVFWPLWSFLK